MKKETYKRFCRDCGEWQTVKCTYEELRTGLADFCHDCSEIYKELFAYEDYE